MSAAVPKSSAPNQASPRGSVKRQPPPLVDYWLLVPALALLAFGFVMVSSASLPAGDRLAGNPLHFPIRHAIAIGLGLVAALLVTQVPMAQWERSGTWLYFIGLLLLILVLVPGIGRTVNGATRWIPVGPFSLQSSEMMKLFTVIYISGYLVRRQAQMTSFWGFARPMILLVVACFLIMLQPDFGTTAVLLATALGLLFMGGVSAWQFTLLLGLATSALVGLVVFSPYRLQRVTTFIDPWADPYDSGFQLTQALIAFGRGEWAGVGLGNGIQKQFYLPEAHTDFLMAVIGEEFGFVGTLAVILSFALITWRAFQIGGAAERLERRFCAYVAYGFGLWIGMQAFINIGVNMGLLPTKGLTLPLMSYGGNSIIVACVVIAMLLRIDWENRQTRPSQAWGKVLWGGV
jgi:cell division protein FtsW